MSVLASLGQLEQARGKDASLLELRRDFNAIRYAQLLQDESLRPVTIQTLRRIKTKLAALNRAGN